MQYWWVNQGINYPDVIGHGTLWTIPDQNGQWPPARRRIKEIRPGDIVLHHAKEKIRAVSRAHAGPQAASRPPGYPKNAGDGDDGFLVRVAVIRDDLDLYQEEYARLIPHGNDHPSVLNKNGIAQNGYIYSLEAEVARRLFRRAGVWIAPEGTPVSLPYAPEISDEAGTDAVGLAMLRREQGRLREYLLGGHELGRCALCGDRLPADLLVAAHILPRSMLTHAQRIEFSRVAMLACALGCDAIFEAGYIVVDDSGMVRPGRDAATPELTARVGHLIGRQCSAHGTGTAAYFAARAELAVSAAP